jgi:hypothetical protein
MSNIPDLKEGQWIEIDGSDYVVSVLFEKETPLGIGEVVFNPSKPAFKDFGWDGEKFYLFPSGDFGGYAERAARHSKAVKILKKGKWA